MTIEQTMMNYIMGATAIIIIVLMYISYSIFRLKRNMNKMHDVIQEELIRENGQNQRY